MEDGEFGYGFEFGYGCGGCPEVYSAFFGEAWEGLKELEDACFTRLEVAEDFEVREEVDDLFFLWVDAIQSMYLSAVRGVVFPGCVAEAVGDVVAEFVVFEEDFEFGC